MIDAAGRPSVDFDNGLVCGAPLVWGPVPDRLEGALVVNEVVEATEDRVLVTLPSGRILVARDGHGERVSIQPTAGHEPRDVAFLAYGWATALVMMMRGVTFLHASVVTGPQATLALASRSGGGKSTSTVSLVDQGWGLCVDDSAPIVLDGTVPWVVPYARPTHLTDDVAGQFRALWSDPVRLPGRPKVAVRIAQDLVARPVDAVVVLLRVGPGQVDRMPGTLVASHGPVQVRRLAPADALAELRVQLYVNHAALTPGRRETTVDWLRAVADRPVFVIARPRGAQTHAEVSDALRHSVVGSL